MNLERNRLECETAVLKVLHQRMRHLLQALDKRDDCLQADRQYLYKIVFAIELSLKEAYDNLHEVKRDLGKVAYHLQIHPVWLLGLLKIVDTLIEQVEGEKREAAGALGLLSTNLDVLMRDTHRYRLTDRTLS